jgi:hypothetical protein
MLPNTEVLMTLICLSSVLVVNSDLESAVTANAACDLGNHPFTPCGGEEKIYRNTRGCRWCLKNRIFGILQSKEIANDESSRVLSECVPSTL